MAIPEKPHLTAPSNIQACPFTIWPAVVSTLMTIAFRLMYSNLNLASSSLTWLVSASLTLHQIHLLNCVVHRMSEPLLPMFPLGKFSSWNPGSDVTNYCLIEDGVRLRTLLGHSQFQTIGRQGVSG